MNIEQHRITVSGLSVEVVRKSIKNLHLGVYPPHGRIRVAAPLSVSDDAVRLAVVGKLGWIRKQRARFEAQPRQSRREMVSGESHCFLGRRYRLRIMEHDGPAKVVLHNKSSMRLLLRPSTTVEQRAQVLQEWYRRQLKSLIPPLVEKWQRRLGVRAAAWGVKKMKTKWGSCTTKARRVWFNLELAKKPVQCLEYIVVHELLHLRERQHNERFQALLSRFMPGWQSRRDELNRLPLGHETWDQSTDRDSRQRRLKISG